MADTILLKSVRQNESYYFAGGDLHLLAEGQLFRVHRYFFERESEKFKLQLSAPASPGQQRQGTSDSNAVILSVKASDFEKFLWVFYNPTHSLYDASIEDWSIILHLAHEWAFPQVKALCLRQLEAMKTMPTVDRVVLYQKYDVDEKTLLPHYADLVSREDVINDEEGSALGMKTTLKICNAREQVRSSAADGLKSPLPSSIKSTDVFSIIQAILTGNPIVVDPGKGKDTVGSTPIIKDPKSKKTDGSTKSSSKEGASASSGSSNKSGKP